MSLKSVIAFLFMASASLVGAQTLQTLCSFNGTNGDDPNAGLTLGNDGNFYGTTAHGGDNDDGTIFKVTTNGVLTTLIFFAYTNGEGPNGLTLGNDGNFYGVASSGGNGEWSDGNYNNYGTVFKVTTSGVLTTLVFFNLANGGTPTGLTLGNDGNFYGTTAVGGDNDDGTIFKVTTNGVLTTLISFAYTNGATPHAGLTLGNDGNFYGTTFYGGSNGEGTMFRVTTNGVTILASFGGTNGAQPEAALTLGNDGNFYGTTEQGGITNSGSFNFGCGTVFKVTTNGILTTLVSFDGTNGATPAAALTLGKHGNFYGTTFYGGTNLNGGLGYGTVFKMTTNGTLTTLISFFSPFANTNGAFPAAALTLGNGGNFYGTTSGGGSFGCGVVFRLAPNTTAATPSQLTLQFLSGYPLLSLYGTLSNTYAIEYSTNLADTNWKSLLIVPNLSISPFQMIDPAGIVPPARFYRALMQ